MLLPRSLLALSLCGLACAHSGSPKFLKEVRGEVARVQVIRAYRFNWRAEEVFRSPDGLGFELMIHRMPLAKGEAYLRHDFVILVNGKPYGPGHHPDLPPTAPVAVSGETLSDYRFPDGRRASDVLERYDDGVFILRLMVPGAPLPLFGTVELLLQVGWDEWTEPIALKFSAWDIHTGEPTP